MNWGATLLAAQGESMIIGGQWKEGEEGSSLWGYTMKANECNSKQQNIRRVVHPMNSEINLNLIKLCHLSKYKKMNEKY